MDYIQSSGFHGGEYAGCLKPYSLVGQLHHIHKCTERGTDATALHFKSTNELNSSEMKFSGGSAYS
jgi:hypothetical protein